MISSAQTQAPTLIGCFFYLLKSWLETFFAASAAKRCALYRAKDFRQLIFTHTGFKSKFCFSVLGLRGQDLNLRPSGYEPDELPDCSTPRLRRGRTLQKYRSAVNKSLDAERRFRRYRFTTYIYVVAVTPCCDGVQPLSTGHNSPSEKDLPNPLFLWIMRALNRYPCAYKCRAQL
jgi:hypothetical protein